MACYIVKTQKLYYYMLLTIYGVEDTVESYQKYQVAF